MTNAKATPTGRSKLGRWQTNLYLGGERFSFVQLADYDLVQEFAKLWEATEGDFSDDRWEIILDKIAEHGNQLIHKCSDRLRKGAHIRDILGATRNAEMATRCWGWLDRCIERATSED